MDNSYTEMGADQKLVNDAIDDMDKAVSETKDADASKLKRLVIRLWKVKECGETFTILARTEEEAERHYKKHMKDIDVPVSTVDIGSIKPVPFDEVIRVNYPDHNDVEVALKAEQWIAIADTMGLEWNILCSSAWV